MDRKRFLDEAESASEDQEEGIQPRRQKADSFDWPQLLNITGSLAGITAISLLTFEMAVGSVRLGKIAAYAMGSSILIGVLLVLVIGFKWALLKFQPGLWRYTFWFIGVPFAFIYYLIFIFVIYGVFSPLLLRMMEVAFANAP
ncbi:MAG: hypothetical protein IID14_01960 [Candidatus Marinimicrobia bacterium]|nr:hypothetical protein [Candidatus Neomarinimicrobiota bacterium]